MSTKSTLQFSARTLLFPLGMVLVIWMVLWIELTFHYNFNDWGIKPLKAVGLRGIIFSPFIHGGVKHALSNTVPILLLGTALFYFYRKIAWRVLLFGGLLTGLLTWSIGQYGSTHIGASGIAYLMFSFLFFKGLFSRNYRLIALSLVVVFMYGSLVWGMFPGKPNISWEGHLSGFISGVIFALWFRHYQIEAPAEEQTIQTRPVAKWEQEFLAHFDEDGNFVPTSEWERRKKEAHQTSTVDCAIEYEFVPKVSLQKKTPQKD